MELCVHHNYRICLLIQSGGLVKAENFNHPADADAYHFRPVLPIDDDDPQKLSEMSHTFVALCKSAYGLVVPNNFIILATKAMIHLKGLKQCNALYNIAKGFGEPRFPTDSDF